VDRLEPTVFIIDGDANDRPALHRLMESVRLRVEGYSTTDSFLKGYDRHRPGCLILEVRIKSRSGVDLLRRLRGEGICIPAIFLTRYGDIPLAVQAMREGAFDFLEKPAHEQYLLDQIHAAIVQDARSRREEMERREIVKRLETLSEREKDILAEIVAGKTNKAMASQFGVAVKTVEFHRANIMKKIGVGNVAELVCRLLRGGWDLCESRPTGDGRRVRSRG